MKQVSYAVKFITPAFLGNADASFQWRTPPFKALLRQWWRMAVAREVDFNVNELRRREGALFGVASSAEGEKSCKSKVRIRLGHWHEGTMTSAPDIGRVNIGRMATPASLYSGFGPIVPGGRSGAQMKSGAAIQPGDMSTLSIAFPASESRLEQAIALMAAYGTTGGRSRNGWGSFELLGDVPEPRIPTHYWKDAMEKDWPHAFGKDDDGPLVWKSLPQRSWENAMRLLAQTRVDLRRAVPDRLMLAYPDARRTMPGWGRNERVPNSLRFKVRSEGGQFYALVFHIPCRPADALWRRLPDDIALRFVDCFEIAHEFMDAHGQFARLGGNHD